MNKNIRDFLSSNAHNGSNNAHNDNASSTQQGNTPSSATEDAVKKKIGSYQRMSDNDLMSEMTRLAGQGKSDGTITEESLRQFYIQVSPMLTEQQRNKLKQLINSLK